jgi:hypothetical protein
MALTRSVLVSTPLSGLKEVEEVGTVWQDRPFKLQVGDVDVMLTYQELSKLMSDADAEIRDYLGEYEDIDCHPNYDAKTDSIKGEEHV